MMGLKIIILFLETGLNHREAESAHRKWVLGLEGANTDTESVNRLLLCGGCVAVYGSVLLQKFHKSVAMTSVSIVGGTSPLGQEARQTQRSFSPIIEFI